MIRRPGGLAESERTRSIIGAFYEVAGYYGPCLPETVYVGAFVHELTLRGHTVAREVLVRSYYKGVEVAWHRLDLLVDGVIVVECKAGPSLSPRDEHQLKGYLRASALEVGFLFHFGARATFKRLFYPSRSSRPGGAIGDCADKNGTARDPALSDPSGRVREQSPRYDRPDRVTAAAQRFTLARRGPRLRLARWRSRRRSRIRGGASGRRGGS